MSVPDSTCISMSLKKLYNWIKGVVRVVVRGVVRGVIRGVIRRVI